MVGQRGFEPLTNGYLQLQNFVIPQRVSTKFCDTSGARRNTGLYYYPNHLQVFRRYTENYKKDTNVFEHASLCTDKKANRYTEEITYPILKAVTLISKLRCASLGACALAPLLLNDTQKPSKTSKLKKKPQRTATNLIPIEKKGIEEQPSNSHR